MPTCMLYLNTLEPLKKYNWRNKMAITHTFINNSLEVFKDGVVQINQPFRPTSTGDQPAWETEQEALEWFYENGSHRFAKEEIEEYKISLGAE